MSANHSSAADALARGTVSIEVISDVVCPWCYVGKRRLEAAIATEGGAVQINWRPFQLDPTIPHEGLDRQAYMTRKFGDLSKLDAVHERLVETGAEAGIDFRFGAIGRAPNTLDAHRLVRWSASDGKQGEVVEALFRAYFIEGRNIGDTTELLRIAVACGFDPQRTEGLLASRTDTDGVQDEIAAATRLGVSGVPFFIFAGRYAVSGAQSSAVLAAAIGQARDGRPDQA